MLRDDVKARHDKMVGLVDAMLKLHKDLPKAKTPHEQESLKRQTAPPTRPSTRWCMSCTD
ncbi:MAG: hypothetical protein NTX53_09185 [candidate division WOR-3 bacterium]|nr:hypothetical protein [candidate division WOR-3 bacterium]